jgi:hypothetical protein
MRFIKAIAFSFLFFIFLGAGCQNPVETVANDFEKKLDSVDYLRCIDTAQKEYDALTEGNTKIPQDTWVQQKLAKLKDCEERYRK